MTLLLGLILMQPASTFATSDSYSLMAAWMDKTWFDETLVGVLIFVIGCARLVGLVINGSTPRSAQVTPWIRSIAALFGMAIWGPMAWGFLAANSISTANAIYPVLFLMEIVNYYDALHDYGDAA